MILVYSRQALANLDEISAFYMANAGPIVAETIGKRINDVIDLIYRAPEAAPRESRRSRVRVASVVQYPFRIFYRVRKDRIDILYIRHTSRRPLGKP